MDWVCVVFWIKGVVIIGLFGLYGIDLTRTIFVTWLKIKDQTCNLPKFIIGTKVAKVINQKTII